MKTILSFMTVCLFSLFGNAQSENTQSNAPAFFAQSLLTIQPNEYDLLQEQLKSIPFVHLVRVDPHSKQLFLITKNLESFSAAKLQSWTGEYFDKLTCVNIGLVNVDPFIQYESTECN